MNARLAAFVKVTFSAGLIVLIFYRVNVAEVWETLRGTTWPLLLLGLVLYTLAIASNAAKWGVLLRAQGVQAPFGSLLRHTFVGVFFNNFLPFVAADMIRGYGLVRETATPAHVAVSVLVDRLVGILVLASTGTLAAWFAVRYQGLSPSSLHLVERAGFFVTAGLTVGFMLLLSGRARRLVEGAVRFVPPVRPLVPFVEKLSAAVSTYRRRPAPLLAAYGVGLTTLVLGNLANWLFFLSIDAPIDPVYVFIFNPIIGLTMSLPISVSGLGVNQLLFPSLYGLAGVAADTSVAASLLLQATIAVTSLPGGLVWAAGHAPEAEQPSRS